MILIIYIISLIMIVIAQFFPLENQISLTAQGILLMLFGMALERNINNKKRIRNKMDNTMKITEKLLQDNGWTIKDTYAYMKHSDGWYAEFKFGRNSLNIWEEVPDDLYNSDVYVRVCDRCWKMMQAFRLANINYRILTPKAIKNAEKLLNEIQNTKLK